MGTYTPPTTLLVQYLATQLAALTVAGGYRTNIGLQVSTERQQVLDTDAASCNVQVTGWESNSDTIAVERLCDVQVEITVPATVDDAEAQARLAVEDVFERFRLPGQSVPLATGVSALIRPVDSATIERAEAGNAISARLTLNVELTEVP